MQNTFILEGFVLFMLGVYFYTKKRKAYLILGYFSISKEKRKIIDWEAFANLMFYTFLVAFFCSLINFLLLQIHHDIKTYVLIWTVILILSSIYGIYGSIKYVYTKKRYLQPEKSKETKITI